MKTIILIISLLFLTSCMHTAMMGSHSEHESMTAPVLEKEITQGDLKALTAFSGFEVGKKTTLSLKLINIKTNQPVSGAEVMLHAIFTQSAMNEMKHKDSMMNGNPGTENHNMEINNGQTMEESNDPGVYSVVFSPSQAGKYQIIFHVISVDGKIVYPLLQIEATRNVMESATDNTVNVMGLKMEKSTLITGVLFMGGMILLMWVLRGRFSMI